MTKRSFATGLGARIARLALEAEGAIGRFNKQSDEYEAPPGGGLSTAVQEFSGGKERAISAGAQKPEADRAVPLCTHFNLRRLRQRRPNKKLCICDDSDTKPPCRPPSVQW
jgi:hypothetical protein